LRHVAGSLKGAGQLRGDRLAGGDRKPPELELRFLDRLLRGSWALQGAVEELFSLAGKVKA
jgi:hypothetical protein